MTKTTIQRCPACLKCFRHGEWVELKDFELKALRAAVYAGAVQILTAKCADCEEVCHDVGNC